MIHNGFADWVCIVDETAAAGSACAILGDNHAGHNQLNLDYLLSEGNFKSKVQVK